VERHMLPSIVSSSSCVTFSERTASCSRHTSEVPIA
jgi:hypothetical protein